MFRSTRSTSIFKFQSIRNNILRSKPRIYINPWVNIMLYIRNWHYLGKNDWGSNQGRWIMELSVYSRAMDTDKMATFDYLPCWQGANSPSINSLYVNYYEQIYVYSIVLRNNINACTFLIKKLINCAFFTAQKKSK